MKSTVNFKEYFDQYILEMSEGGVMGGSAGGFSPDNPTSGDFYAPGDARIATPSKTILKRGGAIKMKIKGKRSTKKRHKAKK